MASVLNALPVIPIPVNACRVRPDPVVLTLVPANKNVWKQKRLHLVLLQRRPHVPSPSLVASSVLLKEVPVVGILVLLILRLPLPYQKTLALNPQIVLRPLVADLAILLRIQIHPLPHLPVGVPDKINVPTKDGIGVEVPITVQMDCNAAPSHQQPVPMGSLVQAELVLMGQPMNQTNVHRRRVVPNEQARHVKATEGLQVPIPLIKLLEGQLVPVVELAVEHIKTIQPPVENNCVTQQDGKMLGQHPHHNVEEKLKLNVPFGVLLLLSLIHI